MMDLGTNVKPQTFVDAAKAHNPAILATSALLTTTMPKMKETIDALREASIWGKVMVMAGGAPVTEDFVKKIGADGYGPNAAVAAEKAKILLGK